MRNIWWKVVINVIILVLLLVIVLNNQLTNRKNIIDITASNFIPFQDGNNLLEINANFKIDSDLPRIEGASAFYDKDS